MKYKIYSNSIPLLNLCGTTLKIFFKNFWVLLVIGLPYSGLQCIYYIINSKIFNSEPSLIKIITLLISLLSFSVLIFQIIFTIYLTKNALTKKNSLRFIFKKTSRKIKTGILSMIAGGMVLTGLLIALFWVLDKVHGSIAWVIIAPLGIIGVVCIFGWIFNLHAIALRNKSPLKALGYSWNLVRNNKPKIILYIIMPFIFTAPLLIINLLFFKEHPALSMVQVIGISIIFARIFFYSLINIYMTLVFINFDRNKKYRLLN
tara:strand:+ start:2422 stop:3201 length:780 start_codon:yes stop_codon:yes gene_type:complete